ncbi:hypothetical protein ES703_109906 [subsurface metagenome]
MSKNAGESERNQGESHEQSFHNRFNIEINVKEAQQRFVNRILTGVESQLPWIENYNNRKTYEKGIIQLLALLAGIKYQWQNTFSGYVNNDFTECMRLTECLYNALEDSQQKQLDDLIQAIISMSEVDLGIEWTDGSFRPVGAKLLDEELVNEPLSWLSDVQYKQVLEPFQKGLSHYIEAKQQPERLADTITDIYEALEAMVKIVTGRDRDLSANRELFISKLNLSDYYKRMLKDYIKYANEYRHAIELGEERKPPSPNEVEAFVYTTGLFIRLAIQQLNQ